jgi:hypothetical protein
MKKFYFIDTILISNLYKIPKKDLKNAANVLTNGFSKESVRKEVFTDEEKNPIITEVMVGVCLKYGNVLSTSDNLEGVTAIAPYDKNMTTWKIIRSGAFFL